MKLSSSVTNTKSKYFKPYPEIKYNKNKIKKSTKKIPSPEWFFLTTDKNQRNNIRNTEYLSF